MMNRKSTGSTKNQRVPDKRKQQSSKFTQKDVITQTANKRKMALSQPHNRAYQVQSRIRSQRPVKAQRSNQKEYRQNKLLYDIKMLQKRNDYLLPKAPFRRIVKQITFELAQQNLRWQQSALDALQYSAQDYLTGLFQDAYACTAHAKRVTLMVKDLSLARRIRGNRDPANW